MELQYLCTNCLNGTLINGICSSCHKSERDKSPRRVNALPDRYMLSSRYYLGKIIGKGGFGITYMAWDCLQQKRVIVKELYPNQDVEREPGTGRVLAKKGQEDYFRKCRQRFREEARILYSFQNEPTIVDVYGLAEENNTVYYAMEYLSGFDLKTWLTARGKTDWPQLSRYTRDILRTLRVVHKRGLIHRDITPDNIFLTGDSTARLIDFGSVRCFNDGRGLTSFVKAEFAPVEQFYTNGNQGPWTDIYSLCVTLYYSMSGRCPPKAPNRVRRDEVIPIARLCPELPSHVARAIMKGMSVRIEDRYLNVEELAGDLFPGETIFSADSKRETMKGDYTLCGVSGCHQGRNFPVFPGQELSLGRDPRCDIGYPPDTKGISRRHFILRCDSAGNLFIMDENSSWGTSVSGQPLVRGQWYRLKRGSIIEIPGQRFYLE
ncbi:MAG: FHA domain-containing serine/threonine-protein kinase [Clostridiales bacterium]|nr:FHA domain-containing serine/threonine-protein kinase [Clostridiales bacterium]